MRALTTKQCQKAADALSKAHMHIRVAEILAQSGEYAAAIGKLYYSAHFCGRAVLADTRLTSSKHKTWNGELNKRFGIGQGWLPRKYVRCVSQLQTLREQYEYDGALANEKSAYKKWHKNIALFAKKVTSETPLCHYDFFIEEFLLDNEEIEAIEFDFYCPKSYIHKERMQLQIMAEKYTCSTIKKIVSSGRVAMSNLSAGRQDDYVVGWNNRLGQSGDKYLLFLDIDEPDEGKVKSALRSRQGWLFKSGGGYHFIGKKILKSQDAWKKKMLQVHQSKKIRATVR